MEMPWLEEIEFQTPSARGGIPLMLSNRGRGADVQVSNPFSAGRDSSVFDKNHKIAGFGEGFKPLQRGAGFL